MDEASGFCAGCFRTLDEIAGWANLPNPAKREILMRIETRRDIAGQPAAAKQGA